MQDATVVCTVKVVTQRANSWPVRLTNKLLYVKVVGEHRSVRAYRNVPDPDTLDFALFQEAEIPDWVDAAWYQWGNDGKRVVVKRGQRMGAE